MWDLRNKILLVSFSRLQYNRISNRIECTCPTSFCYQNIIVARYPARYLLGTCLAEFSTEYNFQPIPSNVVPWKPGIDDWAQILFSKIPPRRTDTTFHNNWLYSVPMEQNCQNLPYKFSHTSFLKRTNPVSGGPKSGWNMLFWYFWVIFIVRNGDRKPLKCTQYSILYYVNRYLHTEVCTRPYN